MKTNRLFKHKLWQDSEENVNVYYKCIVNNISVSLSSHPVTFGSITTLTCFLGVWQFSKSKRRDSSPKQLIPHASKYSIRQEENPEPNVEVESVTN